MLPRLIVLLGLAGCATLPMSNVDAIRGNEYCTYRAVVSTGLDFRARYECEVPLPCATLHALDPNVGCLLP